MGRVLLRWLLTAVPVVVIVSLLTFVLTSFVPGDPARSILGIQASEEQVEALRQALGLNKPIWQQYVDWLTGVLRGDLGNSIVNGGSVAGQLANRIGPTLSVVIGGVAVMTLVGVGLGMVSAVRGGWVGRVVDIASLFGMAVPSFWLGLVLVAGLAVAVPLFPAGGYVGITESVPGWIASLFLPLLTLALTGAAGLAKQVRASVLDELGRDYVRMLRARGLPERRVWQHALRNAAAPIITVIGLMLIGMLGGVVLLETVFVLPGLGSLIVESTRAQDIPVIQGITLFVSLLVVTINLLIELSYALLNPKVRT